MMKTEFLAEDPLNVCLISQNQQVTTICSTQYVTRTKITGVLNPGPLKLPFKSHKTAANNNL